MNRPKISIIIPAYNVAGYIEICLDSILSQTFTDYEVIIINDGSLDTTGNIADKYAGLDSRIKVIHTQNTGVSAARNTGIDMATGDYFLFFDGDDFIDPHACEVLVNTIREKEADVLIYGYYRYRDGNVTQACYPIFPEGFYNGDVIIPKLLSRFVGFSFGGVDRWLKGEKDGLYVENPALWRCIAKSEIIRNNNLRFDVTLKVGEDTIFISDLLSCAKCCYVLHNCLYYLVYRESSTITVYEGDAAAKLEGKQRLVTARCSLTNRVLSRSGTNIMPYWQGTVIMSVIELAFLFSKKGNGSMSFKKRFHSYLSYAKRDEVMEAVCAFKLQGRPSLNMIPLLLLKLGWHNLLFICAAVLNMTGYIFSRE